MSPKDAPSGKRAAEASSPKENARRPALILLIACLMLLVGMIIYTYVGPRGPPPQTSSTAIPGVPGVGGPFTMTDSEGRPATEAILKGRWSVVFFGYTYCPDVCPATLTALGGAKALLGDKAAGLQTVFVSVDPARDTPAQIKAYLESPVFPRPVIGLTGTPAQLDAMVKAYKGTYQKVGEGEGYLMDHTSVLYLMNPQGGLERLVRPGDGPKVMADQIGGAMGLT